VKTSLLYRTRISLVRAAPYVAAVILGVVIYLRAARGPFIWDDNFLLGQLKRYEGSSPLNAFKFGFLIRPTGGADFYRPMITLSLLLDQSLWGSNPAGYHATNLVLHAISILMVALFTWLVLRSRLAAIASAFLFAVHPVHAESVCWISGRTDLACAAFLLSGISLYLIYRRSGRRIALAGSYVLTVFALLSKELAMLAPLLVALASWGSGERNYRRIVLDSLPFAVLSVAFFAVRSSVLYGTEPLAEPWSPLHQVSIIAYSIFTHFQILLLPQTAHLSYEVVMQEITNTTTFAVLLSLVALTWFLWTCRGSAPMPFFGLLWFMATILPASGLAVRDVSTIVSQRFLYLPSVGLAVVFGWAVVRVVGARRPIKLAGIGIAVAIVLAFSALSVKQSALWANELVFWQQFTRDTPTIGWSYYHLGMAYQNAGNYKKAVLAHQAAAELMPEQPEPEYGMAEAYKAQGDLDRAIEHYSKALELRPGAELFQEKLDETVRLRERTAAGDT